MVFRTNAAYQRFQEGRKLWEEVLNVSRDIARMSSLYEDSEFVVCLPPTCGRGLSSVDFVLGKPRKSSKSHENCAKATIKLQKLPRSNIVGKRRISCDNQETCSKATSIVRTPRISCENHEDRLTTTKITSWPRKTLEKRENA